MHRKFVMEKWVMHPHIYINEKNLKNLGLKSNIYYILPYQMTFFIFSKRVFDVRVV